MPFVQAVPKTAFLKRQNSDQVLLGFDLNSLTLDSPTLEMGY